jgi:ribose/xylose/arabinose/galactoside ABC-type transport system permease subunit
MADLGKLLLALGGVIIVVGAVLLFAGRFNLPLGRLPGDFVYRGKNSVFYFPLATSIVISIVLSLIFWLFSRRGR